MPLLRDLAAFCAGLLAGLWLIDRYVDRAVLRILAGNAK